MLQKRFSISPLIFLWSVLVLWLDEQAFLELFFDIFGIYLRL